MNDRLAVLVVAAEMVPFAKTGGLADVVGALPKALRGLGHDVRVAIPHYSRIASERFQLEPLLAPFPVPLDDQLIDAALVTTQVAAGDDVIPVYMVENEYFYQRDGIYMYEDDADRFIFFCRAILEGIRQLGWRPDVIHCHDWQTAIIPNWLKTIYRDDPFFRDVACVYTIHNLAYQGVFGHRVLEIAGVDEYGFLAHPDTPHLNDVVDLMARGIHFADVINTVSETYASEILQPEFGEGLDPMLRDRRNWLYGVLNGIDTELYDPATDGAIAMRYDRNRLEGRLACKAELQRTARLPERRATPVIGSIARLSDQKGFDLICQVIDPLLRNHDVQLVISGTGEQRYHERLIELRARFPRQLAVFFTFNAPLSRAVYAGSDMFLMPSRREPCGLSQMIALRYGAIPIVRATGGLADTVRDFDPGTGDGNGFAFAAYDAMALYAAVVRAVETFRYRSVWQQLMVRAMALDYSWAASARRYVDLYQRARAARNEAPAPPRP